MIRKLYIVYGLITLLLGIVANPAEAGPMLSHSLMQYDFGVIRPGQKITRIFSVANAGSEPVVIKEIVPSLRLVEARIDKMVIAPGDKAQLTVTYDSRYGMGRTDADVVLQTNCAQLAAMTYRLTGYVFQVYPVGGGPVIDSRIMRPPLEILSSVGAVIGHWLGIGR